MKKRLECKHVHGSWYEVSISAGPLTVSYDTYADLAMLSRATWEDLRPTIETLHTLIDYACDCSRHPYDLPFLNESETKAKDEESLGKYRSRHWGI